jgi:hypothetical protein
MDQSPACPGRAAATHQVRYIAENRKEHTKWQERFLFYLHCTRLILCGGITKLQQPHTICQVTVAEPQGYKQRPHPHPRNKKQVSPGLQCTCTQFASGQHNQSSMCGTADYDKSSMVLWERKQKMWVVTKESLKSGEAEWSLDFVGPSKSYKEPSIFRTGTAVWSKPNFGPTGLHYPQSSLFPSDPPSPALLQFF